MIGERSAQEGPDDAGYAVCASYKTSVDGSFLEWHCVGVDDLSSGEDASRTQSSDCSSHNQSNGSGRCSADEGTNFEQGECSQKHPLDVELTVELAKEKLEGAGGKQVGRTIPADVVKRFELISDAWDGSGYDCVVECNAEDGKTRR